MTSKTYAKNLNEFVKLLLLLLIIVIIQLSYTPIFAATLGDINSDGEINIIDLIVVKHYIAGFETLTEQQKELADVNRDGDVNILDASLIQKYTLKIISSFTEGNEETIIMPSLSGKTLREAEAIIKDYGLIRGFVTYEAHSSMPIDLVFYQNTSAGNIVKKNDAVDLKISTGSAEALLTTVYVTKTSVNYHRSDCSYLSESRIPINIDEAKRRGFEACTVCKPPQIYKSPAEDLVTLVYVAKTSVYYHRSVCHQLPGENIAISPEKAKMHGFEACVMCNPPQISEVLIKEPEKPIEEPEKPIEEPTQPKKDEPPQITPSLDLTIVSVTSPVRRGATATLKARTMPDATCNITVNYKSGPSKAEGLYRTTADSQGYVSWSWKVGTNTTPGSWPIIVTASHNQQSVTKTVHFTVN